MLIVAEQRQMTDLEIGPWVTCPTDKRAPLQGDTRVDIAIIGAGYTGISAALALQSAGADVAILESEFAGFGASGRNAGHLTPTIGKDLPTLLMLFGKQRTARLVHFANEAVNRVEEKISTYQIDCDYQPTGNIMAAVHPRQTARLHKACEVAGHIGAPVRFLCRDEMRARGIPSAFIAGVLEERGGTIDPGKYVMGLRRAVVDAGIRLYEQSPVRQIKPGAKLILRSDEGTVEADRVLLATNAYTVALERLRHTIYPLHDTLFETEPLSAGRIAALGWQGREGIYTAHESLESYRLTRRGTLLGGSKGVRYPYGSRLKGNSSSWTVALNEQAFRDRFPELSDVKIAHHWGGWIAMTLSFLPTLGVTGSHRNLYYALGYNGHGVAAATAMGAMAADLMLGRRNEHVEDLKRFVPPLPPEPLRWLLISSGLAFVNYLDRRIDRRLRST